jgi:hypothetical protein
MIESVVQVLATERAAVGWHICSYNNSRISFADPLRAVVGEQAKPGEDTQTYDAARFVGGGADKGDR